ncbi:alpha-amylase [Actinoplanes ianthinogenes]|uniref:Alpha-amylase n=1 Tax=Actinoplanes ianthinogenes TaxID=122358 RepID=A0ABM7LKK8_9ACTN|nr:alpha-amylase [Actinoplanes ianthinogenes]GGR08296.1 alpha-amylase [Actinoplanes ianthinogenes]
MPARRPWRRALAGAGAVVLAAGLSATVTDASAGTVAAAAASSGDVIANLFEWNWPSVAKECTDVLGPNGYGGVQVAPPQDSIKLTGSHPWWEVYQPAGYQLNSRMGNESAFQSMVTTCRAAGVKVYVDAVINHMAGSGGTSYSGNAFTAYNYPGLYISNDFHHKGVECPTASGAIEDFSNLQQVDFCELSHLEDLKTESAYVRSAIAGYLNKLIGYGVSGFRVDAAMHIPHADLAAIYGALHQTADGTAPYIAQEISGSSGALAPAAFADLGSVLGLSQSAQLKSAFLGTIATLKNFGTRSGDVASTKMLSFVANHDTERNGNSLSYKNGATTTLATQFLLGYGYGRPQVYSSFTWAAADDSPPAAGSGMITATSCGSAWTCFDRNPGVLAMVTFHNRVGTTARANWYDDGANLIAFSRGAKGWAAFNNGTTAKTQTFPTGLAAGTYCDLITGGTGSGACTGTKVTVGSGGTATVTVPAKGAVAVAPA